MKKSAYDFRKESRIFALVMLVILVIIMILGILSVCDVIETKNKPEWKPTVSYPMTNSHIDWLPTYYGGTMGTI